MNKDCLSSYSLFYFYNLRLGFAVLCSVLESVLVIKVLKGVAKLPSGVLGEKRLAF